MRRALAIFLLVGFSLPLIAPLLASTPDGASLPACCRRNGKHHCMMGAAAMGNAPSRDATVAERCPYALFSGVTLMLPHALAATHRPIESADLAGPAATVREALTGYRISADRTRQKRGPPSFLSL
ncbi:MAG TPA: hypothetical protein VME68_15105 [Acidobacteriaceae bacterium]|nr:hypothetical protein [Acidobacteriaceae bacterium]